MSEYSKAEKEHLFKALRSDNPKVKNYHIRQALQIRNVADIPEGIKLNPEIEKVE